MKGCTGCIKFVAIAFAGLIVLSVVMAVGQKAGIISSPEPTTSRAASSRTTSIPATPRPTATPLPSKASILRDPNVVHDPAYTALYREIKAGTPVIVTGEVLQKQTSWGNTILRTAVTANGAGDSVWYSDDVYVACAVSDICDDLLEKDIVEMYGYANGREEYTTVLGARREIPRIEVYHLEIVGRTK